MAELVQIYYKEEQKAHCFPISRLYFNDRLTIFFENSPIVDCVMSTDQDKIGVCSWKLKEKLKYYLGKPRQLTQEVIESDYDVLSFTKNSKYHQMLLAADKWHPGFLNYMRLIGEKVGFVVPKEVKQPIYQNHFMAKTKIYQDYVTRYLLPVMELMTNDPEVREIAMMDSKYHQLNRVGPANPDYLREQIGVPFYPMAPFLLERLFSIYIQNNRITVTPL